MLARVQQRLKVTIRQLPTAGSVAPEITTETETLRSNSFPHQGGGQQ
jgi:hypothetical protein